MGKSVDETERVEHVVYARVPGIVHILPNVDQYAIGHVASKCGPIRENLHVDYSSSLFK